MTGAATVHPSSRLRLSTPLCKGKGPALLPWRPGDHRRRQAWRARPRGLNSSTSTRPPSRHSLAIAAAFQELDAFARAHPLSSRAHPHRFDPLPCSMAAIIFLAVVQAPSSIGGKLCPDPVRAQGSLSTERRASSRRRSAFDLHVLRGLAGGSAIQAVVWRRRITAIAPRVYAFSRRPRQSIARIRSALRQLKAGPSLIPSRRLPRAPSPSGVLAPFLR